MERVGHFDLRGNRTGRLREIALINRLAQWVYGLVILRGAWAS